MHDLAAAAPATRGNSLSLQATDLPFGRVINLTYYGLKFKWATPPHLQGPCLLACHAIGLTGALCINEPRRRLNKGILYSWIKWLVCEMIQI
jgi:hypothetical protein